MRLPFKAALRAACILLIALATAAPVSATPAITIPASGAQGDCFAVTIAGSGPESRNVTERNFADVKLIAPSGRAVSITPFFSTRLTETPRPTGVPEPPAFAALVAIPADAKAGQYTVVVSVAGAEAARSPFEITERKFPSETVRLNAKNSAIKQDDSPARKEQIRDLNDILFGRDDSAPRFDGPFAAPVASTRRTSQFWHRRTYRYSNGKKEISIHYGIDFGVPTGTPVSAAGAGRVVMAENRISTGLSVVLEHAPGIFSLYYHLSEILVAEGQDVETGELIARSGSTGLSTGPHLHWEMRVNGNAVSPDWFVGRKLW
jgi:murein DD-endopeptidase MepM/ murein hydrolase activator NlpD